MVKGVSFTVVLLCSIIVSIGFFDRSEYNTLAKVLLLVPLVIFFSHYLIRQIEGKNREPSDRILFAFISIVTAKAIFLYVSGGSTDQFPLDIFMLILLTAIHPFSNVILYASAIIILNVSHSYFKGMGIELPHNLFHGLFLFMSLGAIKTFLMVEQKAKNRAEGELKGIEKLADRISSETTKDKSSVITLTEEEKQRFFLDSAYHLSNTVKNTLNTIREITGAYSCCLFMIERDRFHLGATITESNNLLSDIPRMKGENLLSWIDDKDQLLIIDKLSDHSSLGYYTGREDVTSFLGIPLYISEKSGRAILCVDKKEGEFSDDHKKLLELAGITIAGSLKNSAIMEEMRIDVRESLYFYDLSKKLGSSLNVDHVLDWALDYSSEIIHADLTAFATPGDDGGLRITRAKGEGEDELIKSTGNLQSEIVKWVMEKGQTYNYSRNKQLKDVYPDLPKPLGRMWTFLCIPLRSGESSGGVFIIAKRKCEPFTRYETSLLEALASHLSMAITNATMYKKMKDLAVTDGLTGLFNHRHFQERLAMELERCDRYKDKISFILTDIDFFKKVNDVHGHPAGDAILKAVSAILKNAIRNIDFAARYGGEEFAIILLNSDKNDALRIAERIRETVEKTKFDVGGERS